MNLSLVTIFLYFANANCLKILLYQTIFGRSHVQFSGALVDILADAGHEVHLLMAEFNPSVKTDGTTKAASVRRIPPTAKRDLLAEMSHLKEPFKMQSWRYFLDKSQRALYHELTSEFCEILVNDKELLAWMRSMKFDLVLTSMYTSCQFGLFHLAGIKPVLAYTATPASHAILNAFGIETPSSYSIDTMLSFGKTDEMTYWERFGNFIVQNFVHRAAVSALGNLQQKMFSEKYGPSFPKLAQLVSETTYVFVNTNEFLEFSRPITHKIFYVGGIGVPKPKPVDKHYDELLSKRSCNVLFSFGSLAQTALMPREMMVAFLEAFADFPRCTFIWKTDEETMKDSLFQKYPNVQLVKWMPQNDILNDGRSNVFITHTGLNSLEEAVHAGVPMITMPLVWDQLHNAAIATKRGLAFPLSKWNISKEGVVEALQAVLFDRRYAENAKLMKEMLMKKPNKPRETFLKYVEFAAEFKDVGRNLQLHALNLNYFQVHCVDIIVPLLLLTMTALYFSYKCFNVIFIKAKKIFSLNKAKRE